MEGKFVLTNVYLLLSHVELCFELHILVFYKCDKNTRLYLNLIQVNFMFAIYLCESINILLAFSSPQTPAHQGEIEIK